MYVMNLVMMVLGDPAEKLESSVGEAGMSEEEFLAMEEVYRTRLVSIRRVCLDLHLHFFLCNGRSSIVKLISNMPTVY